MKPLRLVFFALLLSAIAHPARSLDAARSPIAISNVTVIDTTGGPSRPNMIVVVEGDRIKEVGPAGRTHPPKGARVIDGSGKFPDPRPLGHAHPHALRRLGSRRTRSHTPASPRQRRHGRA